MLLHRGGEGVLTLGKSLRVFKKNVTTWVISSFHIVRRKVVKVSLYQTVLKARAMLKGVKSISNDIIFTSYLASFPVRF